MRRNTYSNKAWEVCRVKTTLGVHAEDGCIATTGRPGFHASRGLEAKVTSWRAIKGFRIGRGPRGASKREHILAFAFCAPWDVTKALYLRVENGEPGSTRSVNSHLCKFALGAWTYWNPWSKPIFIVSLQFLRQSEAFVPGPVWTSYSEKVASKRVPVASTCILALPAGQPLPRSEIPWIFTFDGADPEIAAPGAAATSPRKRIKAVAIYILDEQ